MEQPFKEQQLIPQPNSFSTKPLNLSIFPLNKIPSVPKNTETKIVPTYQYTPIIPTPIVPIHSFPIREISPEQAITTLAALQEKEAKKAEQQRLSNARYRDKVRDYKNLGTLRTEKEKIIGMVLLCYPQLKDMNSIKLDAKVTQFIQSLHK